MSKWRPTAKDNYYVIADIHGQINALNNILDRILPLRKSDGIKDKLIILGDLIDRGPGNDKVIDRLIEIQNKQPDQVIILFGNHELFFLEALNVFPGRNISLSSQSHNYSMWINNGGLSTLQNYLDRAGLGNEDPITFPKHRVLDIIPKEHIKFLQELKKYYELDNYWFVHAGADPLTPLNKQDLEVLVWDRSILKLILKRLQLGIVDEPWDGPTLITGHNVLSNKEPVITNKYFMLDVSPSKLLAVELNSREAYMSYNDQKRLVKYELKQTVVPKPIFRRVEEPKPIEDK